jgi:hypothetical protein
MRHLRQIALTLACVAGLTGLAACAQTPAGFPAAGSASTTPGGTVEPSSGTPDPKPSLPLHPWPSGEVTVTGTVVAGVERGCLLLEGYLLVGGDPAVIGEGRRITVTGRLDPTVESSCQQGTVLVVLSAQPA